MIRTEVEGVTRLRFTLGRFGDDLDDLEAADNASARLLQQRARGAAPVRTGRLAASLTATVKADAAGVGSPLVYARVQEYGAPSINVPAQPYLRPALANSQRAVVDLYRADVARQLNKVKGA